MLRPMIVAPMFACGLLDDRPTTALTLTALEAVRLAPRLEARTPTRAAAMPPSPSGFSTLWFGPAMKPSSDIEI